MSTFKIGDKVLRISGNWREMKAGDVGVVIAAGRGAVRVRGVSGTMNPAYLELVESAPGDKESELRAAYVQAAKVHEEAAVTLDKLRSDVEQTKDKEAHLRALKQRAQNEFIAYILQKELPQAEQS